MGYNREMFTLPEPIKNVFDTMRSHNYDIYLVGGPVRNLILNRPIDNWDFATSATPVQILEVYPDGFYNNSFGTVGLLIRQENDILVEITTFRSESNYEDHRHPSKIEWAKTIVEDLSRRDFQINAIAYDGEKIIDPYGGMVDIKNKIITAVGDPDTRFTEDALRLIRAVRFATQLGFVIEDQTQKSIIRNAALIKNISGERIRDEFIKILASATPYDGIMLLRSVGLLKQILPEVDMCFGIDQKSPNRHHIYDVGTHLVLSLKACPSDDPITLFATLIHDVGKYETYRKDKDTGQITFYNHEVVGAILAAKIARRFRLSKDDTHKLVTLVKYHQFTVTEDMTDKAVRRFIRDVGMGHIEDMLALRTGDRIGSGSTPTSWRLELFKKRLIEVQKEPFKITDLKVNGRDVMEMLKLTPGPTVGIVLQNIFDDVVEHKIENEREALIQALRSMIK